MTGSGFISEGLAGTFCGLEEVLLPLVQCMVGGEAPVIATSLDINVYVLEPAKTWLEVPEESDWLDQKPAVEPGT